jgi:hypothetical protein
MPPISPGAKLDEMIDVVEWIASRILRLFKQLRRGSSAR